jgi:hypothetical protein
MDDDGLIAESQGHFDAASYAHQLEHGERPESEEDEDNPPVRRGRPPNALKARP